MTKEEYLRKMAKLAMQMKAVADNYEEGCDYLSVAFVTLETGEKTIGIRNEDGKDGHYSLIFYEGSDYENGEMKSFGDGNYYIDYAEL